MSCLINYVWDQWIRFCNLTLFHQKSNPPFHVSCVQDSSHCWLLKYNKNNSSAASIIFQKFSNKSQLIILTDQEIMS